MLLSQTPTHSSLFLSRVPYAQALDLMNGLRAQRLSGEISDRLLFLEHPPVITQGRRPAEDELFIDQETLRGRGVEFVLTDRGGKLTYHGPGQLVVYFVIDIHQRHWSVEDLVRIAEEGLLLFLKQKGVEAQRDKENPGLWVGRNKIASVGFHIHKNITTHGVALNLNCDLSPFDYFIPCGLQDRGVTSLANEKKNVPSLLQASQEIAALYQSLLL